MSALVQYEEARVAVSQCVRVDEAAVIRDKAAKLAAYARMRDDVEMEVWLSEIKSRACIRIGEISRELEKANPGPAPKDSSQRWEVSSKAVALADAGISTSTAHRYEQLAGGHEVNGIAAAAVATDKYFAEARATKTPSTMQGLKAAVDRAVDDAMGGSPPKRSKPAEPSKLYRDWLEWANAVMTIANKTDVELNELAEQSRKSGLLSRDLEASEHAAARLRDWVSTLQSEFEKEGADT